MSSMLLSSLYALALLLALCTALPYTGTPAMLPGTVQLENYDLGGEGVAYHDFEPANLGGAYRVAEGVDLGDCFDVGNGYSVGWTRAGEWLQYTVNITQSADYLIGIRYASNGCGGAMHLEMDGVKITPIVALNTTGSWQVWNTMNFWANLTESPDAILRVVLDGEGSTGSIANLNWISFSLPTSAPTQAPTKAATSPYVLQEDYVGDNFFQQFSFFTASDPTHGYVTYVDKQTATSSGLAEVINGQVYMSVDNTSIASGAGRKAVRITSNVAYNSGLFILDLEHMPTGCGTWPAYWIVGPNWPSGGEIDILEGVHTQSSDLTSLHTSDGCSQYGADANLMTGSWVTRNCYINAPGQGGNQGCGINGPAGSMGSPFNAGNGGMYVTLLDSDGIKSWFFARNNIPADIKAQQPQPSNWGLPYARFNFGAECPSWHFSNMNIVFNIAMCGDWAGNTFTSSCPGLGSCASYVQNNPHAFSQAYWLINSLRVYSVPSR